MITPLLITVDGAAGSGKTTLGRRLALAFHLPLVDTGLIYRGVMVAAVRAGVGVRERGRLIELARDTELGVNTDPEAAMEGCVTVDGLDAGLLLRDPAHAILLSTLSQIPEVRELLLPVQRNLGRAGAVAVGRDCGTVIFPKATAKFYLEAASAVRLQRREAQLRADGESVDALAVMDDVHGRDKLDAPSMRRAADSHVIDTGALDADAAFAYAMRICVSIGIV